LGVRDPRGCRLAGRRHGFQNLNVPSGCRRLPATIGQGLFATQDHCFGALIGASWSPSVMIAALTSKLASRCKRLASATGFVRHQKGAAALEFAIVAAPTIALTLAILQTGLAFFAGQVLETAVAESSRLIMTGQAQQGGWSQSSFNTQVCDKIEVLFSCGSLMIDVQTAASFGAANTSAPTLTFNGQGQVTNSWSFNPGNPGDIVVMRVMYQWPVFTGPLGLGLANEANGNLLLMATAVFKNEPY
jgi:Flp pilus assembly protein TadG